jgi:hypothetical protein
MKLMNKNRNALILQGPIQSRDFDCQENIKNIIDEFGHLFDYIIISTWEESGLKKEDWPGVHIIESKDVGTGKDIHGFNVGNRRRKIYCGYYGVQYLKENFETDYVVINRSDQFFDLKEVLTHMVSNDKKYNHYQRVQQKGFLYFTSFFRNNPYMTNDFVFAGRTEVVENFLNASIHYEKIIFRQNASFPEGDFILKHIYQNLKPFFNYQEYKYFPHIQKYSASVFKIPYPIQILSLWQETLKHSISFFPKEISQSLLWRGQNWYKKALVDNPFSCFHKEWEIFKEDIVLSIQNDLEHLFDQNQKDDRFYHYSIERPVELQSGRPSVFIGIIRKAYRALRGLPKKPIFIGHKYSKKRLAFKFNLK